MLTQYHKKRNEHKLSMIRRFQKKGMAVFFMAAVFGVCLPSLPKAEASDSQDLTEISLEDLMKDLEMDLPEWEELSISSW